MVIWDKSGIWNVCGYQRAINNYVIPVLMFYISLNLQIAAQYLTQVLHMTIKIYRRKLK